jgi:hypothetical protein
VVDRLLWCAQSVALSLSNGMDAIVLCLERCVSGAAAAAAAAGGGPGWAHTLLAATQALRAWLQAAWGQMWTVGMLCGWAVQDWVFHLRRCASGHRDVSLRDIAISRLKGEPLTRADGFRSDVMTSLSWPHHASSAPGS